MSFPFNIQDALAQLGGNPPSQAGMGVDPSLLQQLGGQQGGRGQQPPPSGGAPLPGDSQGPPDAATQQLIQMLTQQAGQQGPASTQVPLPFFGQQPPTATPDLSALKPPTRDKYSEIDDRITAKQKALDDIQAERRSGNAQENQNQKTIQYGIEQRAKDLTNDAYGIDPVTGKKNLKIFIPKTISDSVLAIARGAHNYQSPMDKARATALEEYKAETAPLWHQNQFDQRARGQDETQIRQELDSLRRTKVASQVTDIKSDLAQNKIEMSGPQQEKVYAQIHLMEQQGQTEEAKAYALRIKAAAEAGNYQAALDAHALGLRGEAANAAILATFPTEQQKRVYQTLTNETAAKQAGMPRVFPGTAAQPAPTDAMGVKTGPAIPGTKSSKGPAPSINILPPISALGGQPVQDAKTTAQGAPQISTPIVPIVPATKKPLPPVQTTPQGGVKFTSPQAQYVKPSTQDWQTPFEAYGDAPLKPVTRPLPGTPIGHNATNDATLAVKAQVLNAGERKRVTDALNLYQSGLNFADLIRQIPEKDLGTVAGNLNKTFIGKVTPGQFGLTGDTWTTANLAAMRSEAAALAVAHLGSQNMRSYVGAEKIADEITKWGSDANYLRGSVKGYADQALKIARALPASKEAFASLPQMTYPELKRLFHDPINTKIDGAPGSPPSVQIWKKDSSGKLVKQ